MLPLREIDIMGVFVAPFALCLPAAAMLCWALVWLIARVPVLAAASRSPLLELALFTGLLSTIVLTLGRL